MYRLSDNHFHRKCYFKREQVPTQTVMKDIMTENLALVYFKSMNRRLKILAGLEPPMQGGGSEWYQPPDQQLEGRAVLQPIDIKFLKLVGFDGLNMHGEKVKEAHYQDMKKEMREAVFESDRRWKNTILQNNRKHYEDCAKIEKLKNSMKIRHAVAEFELMYRTSVTNVEDIVMEASAKEIKRIQQEVYEHMNEHYKELLQCQARRMYDEYRKNLKEEKARLKAEFVKNVEELRTSMAIEIHDINYEKHLTIEKLRHFLQCQNLASQVYVALKEKEEAQIEMDKMKHEHDKTIKKLKEDIQIKQFEINLEIEQLSKRQEFNRIWKKKICHIVKKFQIFVEYCLKILPDHAEFFLNMEKLMMLQLAEASENPEAESCIEPEPGFKTPVPRPHPFYLVCNKGYKPRLDQKLCPKHCTSSASQFPVIVINKRCMYAACDNFRLFTDKVAKYVYGVRGDDVDVEDLHNYELNVPIKYTSTIKLEELKLESSLMQVLREESANVRKLPIECRVCRIPYCFCSPLIDSKMVLPTIKDVKQDIPITPVSSGDKLTKKSVLQLRREPKWESYLKYVEPKKCKCAKTAKKHLQEHLPLYMQKMSPYAPPELPNYETCKIEGLKRMVKRARGIRTPPPTPEKPPSRTRDVSTQYFDIEMDYLCTCFSDDEISKLFKALKGSMMFDKKTVPVQCEIVDGDISGSILNKTASSFATGRAFSLRNLLDDDADLEQIFKNENCQTFEKNYNKNEHCSEQLLFQKKENSQIDK